MNEAREKKLKKKWKQKDQKKNPKKKDYVPTAAESAKHASKKGRRFRKENSWAAENSPSSTSRAEGGEGLGGGRGQTGGFPPPPNANLKEDVERRGAEGETDRKKKN